MGMIRRSLPKIFSGAKKFPPKILYLSFFVAVRRRQPYSWRQISRTHRQELLRGASDGSTRSRGLRHRSGVHRGDDDLRNGGLNDVRKNKDQKPGVIPLPLFFPFKTVPAFPTLSKGIAPRLRDRVPDIVSALFSPTGSLSPSSSVPNADQSGIRSPCLSFLKSSSTTYILIARG